MAPIIIPNTSCDNNSRLLPINRINKGKLSDLSILDFMMSFYYLFNIDSIGKVFYSFQELVFKLVFEYVLLKVVNSLILSVNKMCQTTLQRNGVTSN